MARELEFLFYLFSSFALISGVMVVQAKNPVHSVLFLIFLEACLGADQTLRCAPCWHPRHAALHCKGMRQAQVLDHRKDEQNVQTRFPYHTKV